MNNYEKLLQDAFDIGLNIDENVFFNTQRIKGMYVDGNIALSNKLNNNIDRFCVLSEEVGHHMTSSGNIIDYKKTESIKQERKARAWAYDKSIALKGIVEAYEQHCSNLCEMADYLGVPELYLNDALSYYREKFGICTKYKEYTIYFEPNLGVLKNFVGNNTAQADY